MSRDSLLETGATLSDWNEIQNLAKWLSVYLRTKWLWARISMLSHNKYEDIFRSVAGIIVWSTEHYFFQYSLKNYDTAAEKKTKKLLKHFLGLAFFMFMKYCFVTFKKYEEYWYVIPYEVATDAKNFLLVIVYQKNTSCFL